MHRGKREQMERFMRHIDVSVVRIAKAEEHEAVCLH